MKKTKQNNIYLILYLLILYTENNFKNPLQKLKKKKEKMIIY